MPNEKAFSNVNEQSELSTTTENNANDMTEVSKNDLFYVLVKQAKSLIPPDIQSLNDHYTIGRWIELGLGLLQNENLPKDYENLIYKYFVAYSLQTSIELARTNSLVYADSLTYTTSQAAKKSILDAIKYGAYSKNSNNENSLIQMTNNKVKKAYEDKLNVWLKDGFINQQEFKKIKEAQNFEFAQKMINWQYPQTGLSQSSKTTLNDIFAYLKLSHEDTSKYKIDVKYYYEGRNIFITYFDETCSPLYYINYFLDNNNQILYVINRGFAISVKDNKNKKLLLDENLTIIRNWQ